MNEHYKVKTRLIKLIENKLSITFENHFDLTTKLRDLFIDEFEFINFQLVIEDEFGIYFDSNSYIDYNRLTVEELIKKTEEFVNQNK